MIRRLHIWRDTRGMSLIEFALLAPVLLVLVCGTIDMGYVYMAQTSLTGAVAQAARASAVTQESTQAARNTAMRQHITSAMSTYIPATAGQGVEIVSRVYDGFDQAKPEPYQDTNTNGRYDPPGPGFPGEPFTDRNGNGVWDLERAKAGTTGDVGDVVRYTASYRVAHLFRFVESWNGATGVRLSATAVVRNEPVRTE